MSTPWARRSLPLSRTSRSLAPPPFSSKVSSLPFLKVFFVLWLLSVLLSMLLSCLLYDCLLLHCFFVVCCSYFSSSLSFLIFFGFTVLFDCYYFHFFYYKHWIYAPAGLYDLTFDQC